MNKSLGEYCKYFRKFVLRKTLKDVCENSDIKVTSLSAFENGRANNIDYIYLYLSVCDGEQRKKFLEECFNYGEEN